MTILAIDPDLKDLKILTKCLMHLYPEDNVLSYSDPLLAFKYGFNHPVEVVYTVVTMKRLDGVSLAKMLQDNHPGILVNLISSDESHRCDAMEIMANTYLIKPVSEQNIRQADAIMHA